MSDHAHESDGWGWAPVNCSDIGGGVCIRPMSPYQGAKDAEPAGYIVAHDVEGGTFRCDGAVMVNRGPNATPAEQARPRWRRWGSLARGSLTLKPSIQCTAHAKAHGHVIRGKWVQAG